MTVLYNAFKNERKRVPDEHPNAQARIKYLTEDYHKEEFPVERINPQTGEITEVMQKRDPTDRWMVDPNHDKRRGKTRARRIAEEQASINSPQTHLQAFLAMRKEENERADTEFEAQKAAEEAGTLTPTTKIPRSGK